MTKRFIFYWLGCEYLVTIYDDETAELATRQVGHRWGPPYPLIRTEHDTAQEAL